MKENQNNVRLSQHFKLGEFLNLDKYPENIPSMQAVANMSYGCHQLLEPARLIVGPIIINSGFRCESVNRRVGGVRNSQHLIGQAADIRPKDPAQFTKLVEFFKNWQYTDQLLTGSGWLHISWAPFAPPRHEVRVGYYK
jgi:putative chitinase